MNVLIDYENVFLKNKGLWSKLCSGLFEQYNVEIFILCNKKEDFEKIDKYLYSWGVRGAYVFRDQKTPDELFSYIKEKMDVCITGRET